MLEPVETICMACADAACDFQPMRFRRRALSSNDVLIEMQFCGVCHSDLHIANDHLKAVKPTSYPCVPGHELSGVVAAVGSAVTKFRVGDHAGVGCFVDSCLECDACLKGEDHTCKKQVGTYNGKDQNGRAVQEGGYTLGGYTSKMVVHERFAIQIPKTYPLEYAGPVMCAGVTMFEPMRRYGIERGMHVGVVGIGGLGAMGVKLAKAMGCTVTAISRSKSKMAFAKKVGADFHIASGDKAEMAAARGKMDMILDTVPTAHNYALYSPLVKPTGKLVMLGITPNFVAAIVAKAAFGDKSKLVPSAIGSIARTQEVIDFCAEHNITPDIEIFPAEQLNEVYTKLDASNETGLRYVMDIANTLNEETEAKCTLPPPTLAAPEKPMTVWNFIPEILGMFFFLRWR